MSHLLQDNVRAFTGRQIAETVVSVRKQYQQLWYRHKRLITKCDSVQSKKIYNILSNCEFRNNFQGNSIWFITLKE